MIPFLPDALAGLSHQNLNCHSDPRCRGRDDDDQRDDACARPRAGPRPRAASGLSLAVADICWATTENLFREIDRESVAILRLKCLDYVNGWRRGLYPWSPACRLRRSGAEAWDQQFILPPGWMKGYPRLGMRPIARSIRSWWEGPPSAVAAGW